MYNIVLTFQIICAAMAALSIGRVLSMRNSLSSRYLIMTVLCSAIYTFGYLQEMISTTKEMALASFTFQYVGLAFLATGYFLFTCEYLYIKIHSITKWAMFLFGLFILALVMSAPHHHLYYADYYFTTEGLFPHIVTEKAPIYWTFLIFESSFLLACAVLFASRISASRELRVKRRMFLLFLESLIPIGGTILNITGFFQGFEVASSTVTIMATLMTLTITSGKLVDVRATAYTNLYRNLGTGIIIADSLGNYLDSNLAAKMTFPELHEMKVGTDLRELHAPFFEGVGEHYFEKDGSYYVITCMRLFERGSNIGYIISANDVTEMRERVEEMRMLKEEADIANEAKSRFLANMSHEIRTPLNAIIGMSELSEKEESQEVIRDYIDQIKSAGKVLVDIVTDVLDISKAESGKLDLNPTEYDLWEFLNSVINITNMRIGDRPIEFIVDIDPNLPRKIYGDDVRLRQIFMNLLGNAEKYTTSGFIKLTVDGESDGQTLVLEVSVEDSGRGIKEEDMDKLFKPFSQVDTAKNRGITGTGLGLNISARLIELMQGTYSVKSTYGVGSTFSFTVKEEVIALAPLANGVKREPVKVTKFASFYLYGKKDVLEEKREEEKKEASEKKYPDAKVLVVDDNKVNVKVLCAFLKRFDINPDTALSGEAAIEAVENKEYDLVLMDHMMPGMDGIEATKRIRAIGNPWCKNMKIVACTANVLKGIEEEFKEAGMDGFLPKPIQMDSLSKQLLMNLK